MSRAAPAPPTSRWRPWPSCRAATSAWGRRMSPISIPACWETTWITSPASPASRRKWAGRSPRWKRPGRSSRSRPGDGPRGAAEDLKRARLRAESFWEDRKVPKMSGAEYVSRALKAYGVTHIFFVPTVLSRALAVMDLEGTGISRVITHGEKAAVYMADGFARASGRPGITMAQIVGGLNLAAGLRDAHLAGSPVIAFTGGYDPMYRY